MDNVEKEVSGMCAILQKLKSSKLQDSVEVAEDLEKALASVEEWIEKTLAPDYAQEIEHIRSFAEAGQMSEEESIDTLNGKSLRPVYFFAFHKLAWIVSISSLPIGDTESCRAYQKSDSSVNHFYWFIERGYSKVYEYRKK